MENDNSFDGQSIEKLAEFSVERVTPRLLSISDTDSASSPSFHQKSSNYFIRLIPQKKTRFVAQKQRLVVRKNPPISVILQKKKIIGTEVRF